MDNRKYIKLYVVHYEFCGLFSYLHIKANNIISAYFKFRKAKKPCRKIKIVKIEKRRYYYE